MNKTNPLVSVCIPTYNRAKTLEKTVNAVINNGYENLEIVISDNASTDETQIVCGKFSAKDKRVIYFRHPENQGPTKNFQFAREQANGKYFLWQGDDDFLGPDYIQTCVNELEQDEALVAAAGLGAYFSIDGVVSHYGNVIQCNSGSAWQRVIKYLFLVQDNSIFYGVYRSQNLATCWMPNELAGDWAWVAQVLMKGKAKIIPSIFVYRAQGDSTSASLDRIVAVLGAPKWNSRFPLVATSINISNHLILQSQQSRLKKIPVQIIAHLAIYIVILTGRLVIFLRIHYKKIPFAGKIYAKFFKKE